MTQHGNNFGNTGRSPCPGYRLTRSLFLVGGHGDYVWETGKFHNPPEKDLETWFIRGGSAGAALYTFRQPGVYVYLNHMLVEAVELGALAQFEVEGQWNDDLMKQVSPPQPIVAVEVPREKSN